MRDPDEQAAASTGADLTQARRQRAIEACDLCDPQGQRSSDGLPCRHIDHAAAAARGIAQIREKMGWPVPQPQNDPKTRPERS